MKRNEMTHLEAAHHAAHETTLHPFVLQHYESLLRDLGQWWYIFDGRYTNTYTKREAYVYVNGVRTRLVANAARISCNGAVVNMLAG